MNILFDKEDIKKLIKKSVTEKGYHLVGITEKDNKYIASVQTIEERISDIMDTRRKRRGF